MDPAWTPNHSPNPGIGSEVGDARRSRAAEARAAEAMVVAAAVVVAATRRRLARAAAEKAVVCPSAVSCALRQFGWRLWAEPEVVGCALR